MLMMTTWATWAIGRVGAAIGIGDWASRLAIIAQAARRNERHFMGENGARGRGLRQNAQSYIPVEMAPRRRGGPRP